MRMVNWLVADGKEKHEKIKVAQTQRNLNFNFKRSKHFYHQFSSYEQFCNSFYKPLSNTLRKLLFVQFDEKKVHNFMLELFHTLITKLNVTFQHHYKKKRRKFSRFFYVLLSVIIHELMKMNEKN